MDIINIGIILTYILIFGGALIALYFGFLKIFQNQTQSKKALINIGGLLIICFVAFIFSSGDVLSSYEKYDINSTTSKQVGIGLYTFYLLAFGAVGLVIYSEISKVFKK